MTEVTYQDKQAILTGGKANFFLRGAAEVLVGAWAVSAMLKEARDAELTWDR